MISSTSPKYKPLPLDPVENPSGPVEPCNKSSVSISSLAIVPTQPFPQESSVGCRSVVECLYRAIGTLTVWLQISMGMENRGRQLLAIPPAIACNLPSPTRAPFGSSGRVLEEKAFMPPARVGCMWHPKHIKSSSGTVELKFQTEWRAFCSLALCTLGCTKTGVGNLKIVHFHFPVWH